MNWRLAKLKRANRRARERWALGYPSPRCADFLGAVDCGATNARHTLALAQRHHEADLLSGAIPPKNAADDAVILMGWPMGKPLPPLSDEFGARP